MASDLAPDVVVMDVMLPKEEGCSGGVQGDHGASARDPRTHVNGPDGGGSCRGGRGRQRYRIPPEGDWQGVAAVSRAGRGPGQFASPN